MYWNTIDPKRKEILKSIVESISLNDYYMAGGTALSLQCGNRLSYDFDFFVREEFDAKDLEQEIEALGDFEVTYSKAGTLHGILDGVQVTFLHYKNPLIEPLVADDDINGLYYASILDIAIMKLVAISSRGSRKDYFDLFYLCKFKEIDMQEVFENLEKKYINKNIPRIHIIQSLTYFDDAEQEDGLELFVQMNWNGVKDFFKKKQKELYNIYIHKYKN